MKDLDCGRPETPPHQPTAGVKISYEEIEIIIRHSSPHSALVSVEQLPSGQSFNNRIYFIKLAQPGSDGQSTIEEFVLKLNGRFWGATKIQNEVACLALVKKYCSDPKVPQTLAWSEDGCKIKYLLPCGKEFGASTLPSGQGGLNHGGWILMTKTQGHSLSSIDFHEGLIPDIARQLGDIFAHWRLNIPAQKQCGNITGWPGDAEDSTELQIRNILQDSVYFDEPITNTNQYQRLRLVEKLQVLESVDTYAPNRVLVEPLRKFLSTNLPNLDLNTEKGSDFEDFTFTHLDISPRNIIVSGEPPQITGIVDFEFSGFFPAAAEFLNDEVNNKDDWPSGFYSQYLEQLESKAVATPARGFDAGAWNRNLCMEKLISDVAPWWLPGENKGQDLDTQLEEARNCVWDMLNELS